MNPAAEEMFAKAVSLPQIPHVMQEVLVSLRDENVSVSALAASVGNDQVIAAKVLRLANSSYYGGSRRVASIADAVKLIVLNAFRNLVIASAMVGVFPRIPGFDLPVFWRTSMLVANLAHIIGKELEEDRDMLFTAGLMHGIGQLLICFCHPDGARAMLEACQDSTLGERRAIEQRVLQMD